MSLNKIDLQKEETRRDVIDHFDSKFNDVNSLEFKTILQILEKNSSNPNQKNIDSLLNIIEHLNPDTTYIDTNNEIAILKIQDKIRDLIDFYLDTKLQLLTSPEEKEKVVQMVTKFKTTTKLIYRNVSKNSSDELYFENASKGVFSNEDLKSYNLAIDKDEIKLTEDEIKEYERYMRQQENKEKYNKDFDIALIEGENKLVKKIQNYVSYSLPTRDEEFKDEIIKLFIPQENQIVVETQRAVFCHIFQEEEMDGNAIKNAKGQIQAMVDTARLQADPDKNQKLGYFKKVSVQDTVEDFMSEEKNYGVFQLTENIIDEIEQMDWIEPGVYKIGANDKENKTRLIKHMILAIKYNGTEPPNPITGISYTDDLMRTYNFIRMKLNPRQEMVKILQALNVYLDDLEEDPKIHVTYFDGEGWQKDERNSTTLSSDDEVEILSKHNREMYKKYTDRVRLNAEKFYGKGVKVNSVEFENKLFRDFKILCETYGGISGKNFEEAKIVFDKINEELKEKIEDQKSQDDVDEAEKIINKNLNDKKFKEQAIKQFLETDGHQNELDNLVLDLKNENSSVLVEYQEKFKKFKETEGASIKEGLLNQEKTNPVLIEQCKIELNREFKTSLKEKIKEKIKTDKKAEIDPLIDTEIEKIRVEKYDEALYKFSKIADAESGKTPFDTAHENQVQLVKDNLKGNSTLLSAIREELIQTKLRETLNTSGILRTEIGKKMDELYKDVKRTIGSAYTETYDEFLINNVYKKERDSLKQEITNEYIQKHKLDEKAGITDEKILEEAYRRHMTDDNQEKLDQAIKNELKTKFDETEEAKATTLESIKASTDEDIKNKIKEITERVTNEFVELNKDQAQTDLETEFQTSLEASAIIKAKSKAEEENYFTNNLQEKFKKELENKFREHLGNGKGGKEGFALLKR